MARRMPFRVRLLLGTAAVPLVLWAVLPLASTGAPSARLSEQIERKRDQIAARKGRERVLASDVAGYSERIGDLQADITDLQRRQLEIQARLDARVDQLERIQRRLRSERARLLRLRARLAEARAALARRLVAMYKADEPDMMTVVLEADGFADLLERTEFMQRVSHQDARIIGIVRTAKADATRTERRLDGLEEDSRRVAAAIEVERDEVASVKGALVDRRDRYAQARAEKETMLAGTREDRQHLEGDLRALEAQQAAVTAALRQAAGGGGGPIGPPRTGAGGLVWPVNGAIVSPFGMRWGRLHAGVDISAPAGTPVRAAAGGRVVLLGPMGGYGNYICVQHDGGLSTCYAHLSSYGTSMGASVGQGEVIGAVGCTGHCFGDHLHFETRINGSPVNPAGYL
jgi:peptidoglycan DL-endopeptidase CwlO